MWRLLIALGRFAHALWREDRIRASATEGSLRRLSTGALMLLDGEPYQVAGGRQLQLVGGTCLEYDCRGARASGVLRVLPWADDAKRVQWLTAGRWTPLSPSRITVFHE